jgi:hypothetical protein
MTEENETKSRSHGFSLVIGLLIALPLLYVLSIGPVALCAKKTSTDPQTLRVFYRPVIWLHDHTPLEKPLELYINLWGVN